MNHDRQEIGRLNPDDYRECNLNASDRFHFLLHDNFESTKAELHRDPCARQYKGQ